MVDAPSHVRPPLWTWLCEIGRPLMVGRQHVVVLVDPCGEGLAYLHHPRQRVAPLRNGLRDLRESWSTRTLPPHVLCVSWADLTGRPRKRDDLFDLVRLHESNRWAWMAVRAVSAISSDPAIVCAILHLLDVPLYASNQLTVYRVPRDHDLLRKRIRLEQLQRSGLVARLHGTAGVSLPPLYRTPALPALKPSAA